MTYVALLRGINVGGNNKVDMKKLRTTFETLGHSDVVTYINSGNIIFSSPEKSLPKLESALECAIQKDFNLTIRVVLRSKDTISKLTCSIPDKWQNDKDTKTDVLFLWDEVDNKSVLDSLTIRPQIDNVMYTHGAIVWNVDRKDINKSGLLKIVGTPLYKLVTIRNINTLRKLNELMN